MHSILVVNPKGGSGKTTIATNLAGFFAAQGKRVVFADMDRQQSAANWLARRAETLPHIMAWTAATDKKAIKEFDAHWTIIDSPAGVHGEKLNEFGAPRGIGRRARFAIRIRHGSDAKVFSPN